METKKKRLAVLLPYLLILIQCIIYGFGDPISKVAYETVPVYTLLFVRYLIAFAVLLLLFGKRTVREAKGIRLRSILPACICLGGANIIGNVALGLASATSVAFLRTLSTVITPLLAFVFYRSKFPKKLLPIYVFVILGLYLLCGRGGLSHFGLGEILALVCAAMLAGSLLFGEHSLSSVSAAVLTTLQTAMSACLALVCALLFDGGFALSTITPTAFWIIVYLAVTCTAGGYLLQNTALCTISSRTVALLQCICPVMTGVFSFFILSEHLSPAGILGSAIILSCVAAEILINKESQ